MNSGAPTLRAERFEGGAGGGLVPRGTPSGLKTYWNLDLLSGFLVFLIALPLCLGISLASGYPAIAGVFTAIIGGILSAAISNSELTIKGPAAGLIVIAIGCVTEFGFTGGKNPDADFAAYRLALGVGVAAGIIQVLFGLFRAGIFAEFFPSTAVHGLLAAIGVIIIAKQFPVTLGLSPKGAPLELLARIPYFLMNMNPVIGLIGVLSLMIMFGYRLLKDTRLAIIPAPMVVLIVTVPLAMYLNLVQEHTYSFQGKEHSLGPDFLVNVPRNLFRAITFPDFSGLTTTTGWKYVTMFALIGSMESVLSAKAIDSIDPWRRKTDLDRDLLAIGTGNTLSALVGGLPMISEIVRSKANIDNGARTRFANLFHGIFLLVFIALVPDLIDLIPLAALGAMLVYIGYRLASPFEFVRVYKVGPEQFLIFVSTIVGVLATDLLEGVAIGIAVKAAIHLINGAPVASLVAPSITVDDRGVTGVTIMVQRSAIFSTWIPLRKRIERSGQAGKHVIVDLGQTALVDHTVMANLSELQKEWIEEGRTLAICGLDQHCPFSNHPLAARKKTAVSGDSASGSR